MSQFESSHLEQYPRTVEAAVDLVMARLSNEFRAWLCQFKGDENDLQLKLATGLVPGMSVRAMLRLWKNQELLEQLPPMYRHPDDASSYLLIECWKRLRDTSSAM